MPAISTKVVRRCAAWLMLGVMIASIVVWDMTRAKLPAQIRIATGRRGGEYYDLAAHLKAIIEARSDSEVVLVPTEGSVENAERLRSSDPDRTVDFALLQGGSVSMAGLAVVAPCYPDVVHVVVRKGVGIHSIADLTGHAVVVGSSGSGMRRSAREILAFYGRPENEADREQGYFVRLLEDSGLDAAIVTTGMDNPDLRSLLRSGAFDLLPVDLAPAIAASLAQFSTYEIPRGYYAATPPVPAAPVVTVATTAVLASRAEASEGLVTLMLESLYEDRIRLDFPMLIPRRDVLRWSPVPLHPAARRYFDPQDRIGWLTNVMETLVATKELLFALGAGLYLLWDRWRRLREHERRATAAAERARLDAFLRKTLEIESAQMDTTDAAQLGSFLDDITRIKLRALKELTNEDLRGDQTFLIFLMQCANLINKIQMKIIADDAQEP